MDRVSSAAGGGSGPGSGLATGNTLSHGLII